MNETGRRQTGGKEEERKAVTDREVEDERGKKRREK